MDYWVKNNQDLTVNKETFHIRVDADNSALIIDSNRTDRPLIVVKEGETVKDGLLEFTYKSKKFELGDYAKYNLTRINTENESVLHQLVISTLSTKVTAKKTLSVKEATIGDIFNITINIKNNGDVMITGDYNEELPVYYACKGEMIRKTEEGEDRVLCAQKTHWRGTLQPGKEITITQNVQLLPYKIPTADLNDGFFDYEYLDYPFNQTVSAKQPAYTKPFYVSLSMGKGPFTTGKDYNLSITAHAEDDLTVKSLEIILPEGIVLGKKKGFNEGLRWQGRIENIPKLSAIIKPTFSGNQTINAIASIVFRGNNVDSEDELTVRIKAPEPIIDFAVPSSAESGQAINTTFTINANGTEYRDCLVRIGSEMFSQKEFDFPRLWDSASNIVEWKTPWIDSSKTYSILMTATCKTAFNQTISMKKEKNIAVRKAVWENLFVVSLEDMVPSESHNLYKIGIRKKANAELDSLKAQVNIAGFAFEQNFTNATSDSQLIVKNISTSVQASDIQVTLFYTKDGEKFENEYKINILEKPSGDPSNGNITRKPAFSYPEKKAMKFDMKSVKFNSSGVIISVAIVLCIFFLVLFFAFMRTKGDSGEKAMMKTMGVRNILGHPDATLKDTGAPYPTTNLDILEEYVHGCLLKGKEKGKIKEELIKNGWMEEVVSVYLK
jgi:hypothetical protein